MDLFELVETKYKEFKGLSIKGLKKRIQEIRKEESKMRSEIIEYAEENKSELYPLSEDDLTEMMA